MIIGEDTVRFFRQNKYRVGDLVRIGQLRGLTEAQIYAGMEELYRRIQSNGHNVPRIELAREMWKVAATINAQQVDARLARLLVKQNTFRDKWNTWMRTGKWL